MYNAVLRACRVKGGTSSATRHLTGQQQSKTMASSKLSKKKKMHGASRSHIEKSDTEPHTAVQGMGWDGSVPTTNLDGS